MEKFCKNPRGHIKNIINYEKKIFLWQRKKRKKQKAKMLPQCTKKLNDMYNDDKKMKFLRYLIRVLLMNTNL